MAVQAGAACYETAAMAAQAVASSQAGSVVQSPAGLYSLDVVATTGATIEYSLTALDGGPVLASVVVPFTPQPCNLLQTADAVELGWKLVLAFALAFGVKFLARSLKG